MMRHCAAVLLGSIASFPFYAQGAETVDQKRSQLAVVLRQEADGQLVDRKELLAESRASDDDATAWHAGRVRIGDRWSSAEELSASGSYDDYLAKRKELDADPQKHFKLARWCLQHDYPLQARAHFYGVLAVSPNHADARRAVGHVQVGDQWVERADLKAAQAKAKQIFAQLDEWVPKLVTIAKALQSENAVVKTRALDELEKLDAAAALPALEMFAFYVDSDLAIPLIRKIATVRSGEACEALVRVALAHPSAAVRRKATETIRTFPEPFYVPELLGMLRGEIEVHNQLVMQPNGHIGLTTLVHNELKNRNQMQRFEKHVQVISTFSSRYSATHYERTDEDTWAWSIRFKVPKSKPQHIGLRSETRPTTLASTAASATYVPAEVASQAAENLRQQGKQQEYLAKRQNRLSKEQMKPVFILLRETTGAAIDDDPKSWWTWWNDRYERYESAKPTAFAYNQNREQIAIETEASAHSSTHSYSNLGKTVFQWSCLVPGTLVQTESGLVPIETIQIGDLVLSQDPETAELALQPVLLTTIRDPKPTLKIVSDKNTIEATGGHLWWVSGRGWMKSRDLRPGMMLHTVTGNVAVREVIENPTPRRTHNLVVDRFHTYFVGPSRVLSYDNSQVKPCLHTVPGFGVLANDAP